MVAGVADQRDLHTWPRTAAELRRAQERLACERPPPWTRPAGVIRIAGCALVSLRAVAGRGAAGDPGFAAAVLAEIGGGPGVRMLGTGEAAGALGGAFEPGLLALREGGLLQAAVESLPQRPEVVLVQAAGRDHPRRAGLAVMLGAILGLPTAGVTARPLVARGALPADLLGARSPLALDGETVAVWVRTRPGARPVVAHAGWRITPRQAADLVLAASSGFRYPEPIRRALERARRMREEA
jgi:deoxyribonuclease V